MLLFALRKQVRNSFSKIDLKSSRFQNVLSKSCYNSCELTSL